MTRDLSRLFRPRSIAVIGGGVWCASVTEQCRRMGYDGAVWPVHPKRAEMGGLPTYASLGDLPGAPDATFIGVNRNATIDTVRDLAAMGGGGAVCFASGFREAQAEMGDGDALQDRLLDAAGDMPIIGPNCYGFINYLDGALLWPDQHGGTRCDKGVALITQSSNIAINLTMQARGLPLAYVATAGNQAQTGLADIGQALLEDPRVTALGLHIEGVGDLAAFEALARRARALGKPVVALKAGKSVQARAAAVSHTASLAGSDAGARALLRRLGIAQVESLSKLLETLKLLHLAGPLRSERIISMSCSGGEASLMADAAVGRGVTFPLLDTAQHTALRAALGPMVALANPLDYHTFIWDDVPAMTQAFTAALSGDVALGCLVVDFPRTDRCSDAAWDCTLAAGAAAAKASGTPLAFVASLPENLSEEVAQRITDVGLIPLLGIEEAMTAIETAATLGRHRAADAPVLLPGADCPSDVLSEAASKAALAAHGVTVPQSCRVEAADLRAAAEAMPLPLVLKGEGFAHKTEAGAVALGLATPGAVMEAAARMNAPAYLLEEMITGTVAELLIGVVRDPAHGFVLTIAAGGVLTEMLKDSASLILPVLARDITEALDSLRIAPMLAGYRGQPGADRASIVAAIMAVQEYAVQNAAHLQEAEINPLICTATRAVAADALIRTGEKT
ncbi:acetate--CoA ligase family protein [Roseovarius sp. M141]|uniref:acetate--CoA ligase family protein n=1 Tax=Roseovarius sp. M141 TaxID=2583806 RepID=UPI0020CF56D1|nr:acetate--CoA ligase family protein [Roseovarius sp. M141]MCQ0094016.1 acetate--CoA ligase family protein [Roseovarius sp. M141]